MTAPAWMAKYPGLEQWLQRADDVILGSAHEGDEEDATTTDVRGMPTAAAAQRALDDIWARIGQAYVGGYGVRTVYVGPERYLTAQYRLVEGLHTWETLSWLWAATRAEAQLNHTWMANALRVREAQQ